MEFLIEDIVTQFNMSTNNNAEILTTSEIDPIINEYLEQYNRDCELYSRLTEYVNQLDWYDKMALKLAIQILSSSFSLLKSNGYNEWNDKRIKEMDRDMLLLKKMV
jgi:hypothetical protein